MCELVVRAAVTNIVRFECVGGSLLVKEGIAGMQVGYSVLRCRLYVSIIFTLPVGRVEISHRAVNSALKERLLRLRLASSHSKCFLNFD